ncbi:MAG TPA: phosphoribosylformylglycinamidine synthase subunit PurQ [Acidobacteriota bacterium]|nr:phosphoribosylformylglycinamidine synthase subunit PurQ [Acidobacteriota bacterium]
MKFGVVVFPGTNSDHDTHHVLSEVMGQEAVYLWHQERDLRGCDVVVLPGGFAHGDYLRCGAIAKFSPIMDAVQRHAQGGGIVMGICNGMQILQEAGLLPGTMLRNRELKFVCEHVYCRVERTDTPFTSACREGQLLRMPIAHNEGNFFVSDEELARLEAKRQVLFRYADAQGRVGEDSNPNGSAGNIAGILNERGNVMALMPHPERAAEEVLESADGRFIFQSLVDSLAGRLRSA